jgi:phosphonate transport system substrate-binding protein
VLLAPLAAVLALALGACAPRATDDPEVRPSRLRVGWVPNDEDVERRVRFAALTEFLSRHLDMPVELVQTGTYSTAIEAMRAGKLDVSSLGPFAYLIAHEKTGAEAIVAPGTPEGVVNTYRSIFVVPKDSPLRTMDEVKARAANLTLAWVDPASASGHLVPRAYLESIGMNPEEDFKSTIFTLSHLSSAMTAKAGKVDLAVITENTLRNLILKGRLAEDDLRVIWTSAPIANSVTAVRGGMSPAFKEELRAAYLAFRTADPVNWALFAKIFPVEGTIWVAAHDRDYDELRALARNVKNLDLLD